ncbi:hypothetical protein CCP4SC76_4150002 [Gammaproteobacteria bacterium]
MVCGVMPGASMTAVCVPFEAVNIARPLASVVRLADPSSVTIAPGRGFPSGVITVTTTWPLMKAPVVFAWLTVMPVFWPVAASLIVGIRPPTAIAWMVRSAPLR